ncbi:MAG: hypothetical protein ACR2I3_14565 [Rhodococcus sp. (in: high G+C Gram-positive bacteria)]|uniref:hypothetical protein n=1 Tax=Rhodococcus sp. TaxID=1831 RepID=UPI003D9AF4D4
MMLEHFKHPAGSGCTCKLVPKVPRIGSEPLVGTLGSSEAYPHRQSTSHGQIMLVIVSDRALIIRDPIFGSFAHDGKPHVTWELTIRTG